MRRAAILIAGSLLATAWVTVPLLTQRPWAALNEAVQDTGLVNGYGAHQVIEWLITGQLLDHGRLPVITVIAAVGFGAGVAGAGRRTPTAAHCWPRSACACCSPSVAPPSDRWST